MLHYAKICFGKIDKKTKGFSEIPWAIFQPVENANRTVLEKKAH